MWHIFIIRWYYISVNDVQAFSITKGPSSDQPPLPLWLLHRLHHTAYLFAPPKPGYLLAPNYFISVLLIFANTALPRCDSTFSSHNLFSIKLQPLRIECCYICAPGQTFCTNFFIPLSYLLPLDYEPFKGRRVF